MIPQANGTRWKQEEIDFIKESIKDNKTLEEIAEVISLRSKGAILTKANTLGYGNYTKKIDGFRYFKDNINHKNRSCKNKRIPTKKEVDTDSITKTVVNLASYEGSLDYMLDSMKETRCLHL